MFLSFLKLESWRKEETTALKTSISLLIGMCISGKNTIQYSLRRIRIIFEKLAIKNPPRTLARTMTQGAAFMICMKSICLFHQLRHQHSTSKLFERGLRQIGLHVPKIDHYLFIYFTEHGLHDGELDTSK